MKKAFFRIVIAFVVALILSSLGLEGGSDILQPLYMVLGILYSIAMSLIVTFNLSQIKNPQYRSEIRKALKHIRDTLTLDFALSSAALIINVSMDNNKAKTIMLFSIKELPIQLNIPIFAICIVLISMLYEVINFYSIQSLNDAIVEKVLEEENIKKTE